MKKTLVLLALILVTNSFAQTEGNISEETGFFSTLKRNNIGLSVSNEIKSSSKEGQINGFNNKFEAFVSYKMTSNDSFKFGTAYSLTDTNTTTLNNNMDASSIRYKRSNILTQESNFVGLNSEARFYLNPTSIKDSKSQAGNTSLRNTFSRKFSPDLKLSTELRWDEYLRTTSKDKITRRKLMVTMDPTYSFTDKLSATPEIYFTQVVNGPKAKDKNSITLNPKIDYAFTKQFATQVYWETVPMVSNDQKMIAKDFASNGVIGLVLTYTIL